jgi:GNAT superfamily N-acetyltransferase
VAIGRYRRDVRKPDTADVGIGVVGDWRGRGLGRSLLTRLARDAGRAGIHRFTSVVSVSDGAALALLRALNPEVTVAYRGFGVVRYEVSFARRFCNLCGRQIEVAVGDPQPMAGPQNHVCSGCLRRYVPKVQLKLADPWWV